MLENDVWLSGYIRLGTYLMSFKTYSSQWVSKRKLDLYKIINALSIMDSLFIILSKLEVINILQILLSIIMEYYILRHC